MLKKIFFAFVALFLLIQLVPVNQSNPPETSPISVPESTGQILARACYDCHSNKTKWPWYSRVAPVSWWVTDHVNEGREHLNFSNWGAYGAEEQAELAEEIVEEVEEGKMPMPSYVVGHPEAELSEADIAALRVWAGQFGGEGSEGRGRGRGRGRGSRGDGDD